MIHISRMFAGLWAIFGLPIMLAVIVSIVRLVIEHPGLTFCVLALSFFYMVGVIVDDKPNDAS